ncbi:protoporphyrinogen oxidase [Botrimarina sp.]|uniref:protoporphyrinogen oxidase n=1 Tax=Botrimarina sp. TaxID=2795802 RepID=UPI0032ED6A4B
MTTPLAAAPPVTPPRVAILGGGITGLAAALRLQESALAIDWRLYEADSRLGGVLQTVERDGYRVELSADNFLTREPWARDLATRVGLADDLLPTDPARRRALVVSRGRVLRAPEGFVLMAPQRAWPVLASPVLSLAGKLRLAAEPLVPPRRDTADESVASFARRRLGREVFERLVQPLVGGIYTADPERLSMQATMPQFVRQEREHGSLVRAALSGQDRTSAQAKAERHETGARYGLFVAPRLGMQQLVDAVAARLPADRLATGTRVGAVTRSDGVWRVLDDGQRELGQFDAVVVTLPSRAAAAVLSGVDPALADELGAIEYAGCSVVCLGVHQSQITRPVDGFGFVVPAVEKRRLIAASFASYKFPGRTPPGHVLIRGFVGGALQPELADADDDRLIAVVREELADLVGLRGDPQLMLVARWPRRMPQYHLGHLDRVARIEQLASEHEGLELAGAAYRGVGVPQCVHSAERAAERVLERLALLHSSGKRG